MTARRPGPSLVDVTAWTERHFVGRQHELELFENLLDADGSSTRVLLVHGPGGIGKTTLLDAFAARAGALGWCVHHWTADQLVEFDVDVDELGEIAARPGRQVLIVDGCDDKAATWRQLRVRVGERLTVGNRLVVASRQPPEESWHASGWDRTASALGLGALGEADADDLVRRRGLDDERGRKRVLAWAGGHPLALALGADVVRSESAGSPCLELEPDVGGVVVKHLLGRPAHGASHRVLAAAALAPELDEATIAAAVPDVDPRWAEGWLRGLSFVKPQGSRLRIHDSVREVVAASYASAEPEAALSIRRNLADHYLRRGLAGEPRALIDISGLVRDPALRYGLGQEEGHRTQATAARPEEYDELMELSGYGPDQRDGVRRWFEEAPEHIVVARGPAGELVGWVLAATLSRHPAWVGEDPVLGSWFEYANDAHPGGDAFFPRDLVDLGNTAAPVPATIAWGHAWFVQRMGISRERYCYAAARARSTPGAMQGAWLQATGHRRIPELTVGTGDEATECWFTDHGDGGLAALVWRVAYDDMGLTPPDELPLEDVEGAVRDALRGYHDDGALTVSPLARGAQPAQRAAHVRRVLDEGIAAAFGPRSHDRQLRRLLELTFLDPVTGIGAITRELAVSRATYYRRLDEAVRRLAAVLG
jgi:hypothetical protein